MNRWSKTEARGDESPTQTIDDSGEVILGQSMGFDGQLEWLD